MLPSLASLFLRLGFTAFGGPAAHIALMEDEVVRERGWLSRDDFLDLLGAAHLIPGPNSTELAIHIGHRRAGVTGLLVAGACFIAPAALIVTALAWAYVRFGALPAAQGVLYGVKPVVIAVVAQALWRLARSAVKSAPLAALGTAAMVAAATGVNELAILLMAALVMMTAVVITTHTPRANAAPAVIAPTLLAIFLHFAKIGAVLFGSGYVLLAFLHADFVAHLHWLTERQLLDAVAVGQITPGPLFTTATFVGYLLAGPWGAAAATAGIFLPAFFFVAVSGPLIPRIRRSRLAGAALDGVIVASLALMAVVAWRLAGAALVDWKTIVIAGVSAIALLRFRVGSGWLVAAGAVLGAVIRFGAA